MKLVGGTGGEGAARDDGAAAIDTDARAYSRVGWIVVIAGVVAFLLWATLAPLDKGVPMEGFVASEGNRKAVQHLAGGIVDDILVREGEQVKAGQVLVRMNGIQAKAQYDATASRYFAARTAEARLLAERDALPQPAFPSALSAYRDDPRVQSGIAVQRQLFAARRAALASELAGIDESIAGLKLQVQGMQAARESRQQQAAILREQVENIRRLAADGFVPRSRQLDLERNLAQLQGAMAEDTGNIGQAQRQMAELALRRGARLQAFRQEVGAELARAQEEAAALEGRIAAEAYALENVEVKAPTDGVVMDVNVFTRGGVVQPGFRMMDIVPAADALVVEGQLPVNLVDKVHPGLPVELIFSSFNASTTPHIPGVVRTVSADRLVDQKTGIPYYRVSARVTPEGLALLERHKLQIRPGMPVQLFVRTGERTMMNYLLKPLLDRTSQAMTED